MFFKYLSISLAVHAALWLVLGLRQNVNSADKTPEEFIEVAQAPQTPKNAQTTPAKTARAEKGGGRSPLVLQKPADKLSLSDLGIQWKAGEDGVNLPAGVGKAGAVGKNDDYGGEGLYGSGGNLLAAMKGTVSYRYIYEMIDHRLYYPPEFNDAGIEGTVQGRIVFSAEGKYLKEESRLESQSRYLRVFVRQILREVLDQPLPETFLKGREKKLVLKCLFRFDLRKRQSVLVENVDQAVVSSLAFYRAAGVFGQWKLGPLAGVGLVPAVGVDPNWFVDEISGATSNKAPVDPLRKYRDDPEY